MKTRRAIGVVAACALVLLMMAPAAARADERNQATQLTFDQSVRIPNGVVLPPGSYWFTVNEDASQKNLVRVTDADGSLITTMMALSAERLGTQASGKTVLMLAEGGPDRPYTLVKWFYPGRLIGHEFQYSPQMESQISEERMITVFALPTSNGTEIASARY